MKKIVSAADLGGAPFFKDDFRTIFNSELWDAIQAIMAPYNSDTEGLIVSGCALSANGGGFDMTAGIVYLNGEFMRIPAATAQSFTKYIAPATVVDDSRTFADGSTHVVTQTKVAQLQVGAPGSGQYIRINSFTDATNRRWAPGKRRVFSFSGWNMDTTATINVSYADIDPASIVSIRAVVTNLGIPLDKIHTDDTISGGIADIGGGNITLRRRTGGFWDNAVFTNEFGFVIVDLN